MTDKPFVLGDALECYARLSTLWANMSDSERGSHHGASVANDYYNQYLAIVKEFTRLSVDYEVSLVSLRRKDDEIRGLKRVIGYVEDYLL